MVTFQMLFKVTYDQALFFRVKVRKNAHFFSSSRRPPLRKKSRLIAGYVQSGN